AGPRSSQGRVRRRADLEHLVSKTTDRERAGGTGLHRSAPLALQFASTRTASSCLASSASKVAYAATFSLSCSGVRAPKSTLARCRCENAYAKATCDGGTPHCSASATTFGASYFPALLSGDSL